MFFVVGKTKVKTSGNGVRKIQAVDIN